MRTSNHVLASRLDLSRRFRGVLDLDMTKIEFRSRFALAASPTVRTMLEQGFFGMLGVSCKLKAGEVLG